MKHYLKLSAIIVSVFFIGYLFELLIEELPHSHLDLIAELFTVFASFSIFAMTWFAYSRSRDNHALFLGSAFLAIGLLDFFHTLSYPFMPAFITSNSEEKAAFFWIAARLISAPLFFISVYIHKDTSSRLVSKPFLLMFSIVLSFIFLVLGLFYLDEMPSLYSQGRNFSIARIFELIITLVLVLYASYFYVERIRQTGENNLIFLVYGFTIAASSDVVYFAYEVPGHLLKIAAFCFIFLALYRTSVELPYEKLAIAEEKLRLAAEENYRTLIENIQDGIFIIQDAKIQFANEAFANIAGYAMEEVIGKSFMELVAPEDLEMVTDRYRRRQAGENVPREYEFRMLHRNGSRVIVNMNVGLINYRGKTASMGTVKDITGHKKTEEIIRENERLAYASKAKTAFIATVSHELRTPLNAIIGFSELMKEMVTGELNAKQQHYIENILASSRHLLDLINDVLDLSKAEVGRIELEKENISVPETINEVLTLVKEKATRQNVIIKKELDSSLEFIEADKLRVKQVLFNLLDNAVKFSKREGGTITVTVRKENGFAKFLVSDTGIGIKGDDMGKLFMEFEQLDTGVARKYGGTGLGLAISKKLVELHGGKIWAESKYGEGSTFAFTLPLKATK